MSAIKNTIKEPVRKLTPHDLAFGIGRKFTDEELELLLEETKDETYSDAETVSKRIDKEIAEYHKKKSVASNL